MSFTMLKVENKDASGTLRKFLGRMLESGFVDALLVPKALPGGDGFVQSLVRDPGMLKDADPLAPTMAVQSARILSDLTATPFEGRVGVVLKPCEMRAAVELVKFLQIKLDNVVTIGVDCLGTADVKDYADMADKDKAALAQALIEGTPNDQVREACRICEHPAPVNADVTLGLIGCKATKEIVVIVGDRVKEELAEKLSLELKDGEPAKREDAIQKVIGKRGEERKSILGEMKERSSNLEALLSTFSTCIRCHNCMNVCPICYCKECVFESPVFEHKSDQFLKLAERKGAIRMPSDTLMFHLTRLSHMGTSCVGCGMCDSACPNGLPVSSLFSLIGEQLQQMFDYIPGRDTEEEVPVSAFREKELEATAGEH